jgi:rod shape-determining protein MreD
VKAAVAFLLLFSIGFQALAGGSYRVGGVTPDFPFLALVYLALFLKPADAFLLASLTALTIDLLSLDPLGTRLLGYLPPIALIGRLRQGFISESVALRAFLTLAAASIAFTLEAAYLCFREGRWPGLWGELSAAFYTALVGAAFHSFLDAYRSRRGWSRDRFFA